MNKDLHLIKSEIDRLKNLLDEMLESSYYDKDKILEVSHELDYYIIKYYEIVNDNFKE